MSKLNPGQYAVGPMVFTKFTHQPPGGDKVVIFSQDSEHIGSFEIRCNKQGMTFRGEMFGHLTTEKELNQYAKLIGDAWAEKCKLDPKILKPKDVVSLKPDPAV